MRRFYTRMVVVALVGAGLVIGCVATGGDGRHADGPPDSGPVAPAIAITGTPPSNDATVALSPDGLTLAVSGRYQGRKHLWLKPVGDGVARPLPNTIDAIFPFWSPDGTKLGFFADDAIKQIDIQTGEVKVLVPGVTYASGASWGKNGTILFSTAGQYLIWRVAETGGRPQPAAMLDGPNQFLLSRPHFLPDGTRFIFHAQGTAGERGIYQASVAGPVSRKLIDSESAGVYASGKLFYTRNGELHAISYDPERGAVGDDDQLIARNVAAGSPASSSVTSNGVKVAYRIGGVGTGKQLVWYDRAGTKLGTVGAPIDAGGGPVSLSPDGKSVVLNLVREGNTDIGVVDLATGKLTPLSQSEGNDLDEIWSSDGRSVLFSSKRTQTIEMYEQEVGAPENAKKVFFNVALRRPMDMTSDGRYLFYRMNTPDLWVRDQRRGSETNIIPPGSPAAHWPKVSPDGRWIVVQSHATGAMQIALLGPFDPPSMGTLSKPLTTNGGGWPRWRGDGRELFYIEADGSLMAISLDYSGDGKSFSASAPTRLFTPPINSSPVNTGAGPQYAVTPDGQRFLVMTSPEVESPVYLH